MPAIRPVADALPTQIEMAATTQQTATPTVDPSLDGVEAAPIFRYSIRVDGVFEPEFVEQLERMVFL